MAEIRYMKMSDKEFWYRLDKHLPETEFENKVYTKRGYVLLQNNMPIGLLRYNLFSGIIPLFAQCFLSTSHTGERDMEPPHSLKSFLNFHKPHASNDDYQ